MEDHYSLNIARRIKPDSAPFGPYYTHHFKVVLPGRVTKREALEVYDELVQKYPEPDFQVMLMHTVVRTTFVKGRTGVSSLSTEPWQELPIGR